MRSGRAMLAAVGMVAGVFAAAAADEDAAARLPYGPDPVIVKTLQNLSEGRSLVLPPARHMAAGKAISGEGRSGPYARDYTDRMVFAPERQTALYEGGNHGAGRTCDVWEYHLGSNTWHRLFAPEGGDHARFKWVMMFAAGIFGKNPDYQMKPDEQKSFDECRQWWKENVILTNGQYLTRSGGPLIVGHTWDTLVYEPNTRRTIHGTGAYCANAAWLEHKFTGTPLTDVQARLGKAPNGKPYRTMWFFDPAAGKWSNYASDSELAVLRGMGATMCYIPDWKKVVFYVAAQNVSPNAFAMRTWDPVEDVWEELKPNGGKSIGELATKDKVAPMSEQQTAYSSRHKKLVAVLGKTTYAYDIVKNEWARMNDGVPLNASDANTIFAYDDQADAFLLADPRSSRLAAFDLAANVWTEVKPDGPAMPKPPYCVGKGYYDPVYHVLVIQCAYTPQMWVYRHRKAGGK